MDTWSCKKLNQEEWMQYKPLHIVVPNSSSLLPLAYCLRDFSDKGVFFYLKISNCALLSHFFSDSCTSMQMLRVKVLVKLQSRRDETFPLIFITFVSSDWLIKPLWSLCACSTFSNSTLLEQLHISSTQALKWVNSSSIKFWSSTF